MTISTEVRKAGPFVGNGSASSFPFAFKVFKAADLIVVRRQDNIGVETTLVLDSDYHVTLNVNQDTTPGGVVTLTGGALVDGFTLIVSSELPYLQTTDLTNQGGFYPKVITNALDRLTIFCQQLAENLGRTLKLPITAPTNISTEIPLPNPSELLAWNETGTGLTTVSPQSLVTSIAYGTATADMFAGDGVTTTFPLTTNPASVNNLDVSIGGYSQRPVQDGVGDYSWNGGASITFVTPPPAPTIPGDKNVLVRYMQAIPVSDSEALHAQTREALRRSYAEAGYHLVDGSFETGGTLTATTEVLLQESTGAAYAWAGSFPKVVAPGFDPVGVVGFELRTDVVLHDQLTAGGLTPEQIGNKKSAESPRISWYANAGDDITTVLPAILADVAASTGVLIIDVDCLVSTFDFTAYTGLSEIRFDTKWRTITQVSGTEAHMLIMGDDQRLIGGRLRGDKASQTGIWFGVYFNSVSDSGVLRMDIRNFSGNGAHFVGCEDTFCEYSTIRDIGANATEYEGGQYVSNCSNHRSRRNDIRDVGNNGIKFRSDTLGGATGCESIGDRVFRAGRIGIANGKMKDHTVKDWYCVDCADNGIDFNGCDAVTFGGGISRGCLDGVYLGENGITNSHGYNFQCFGNGRAGVGSLGSMTNCSITGFNLDGNGSGIYCSGFNGFRIANGRIANSAVKSYTPPESGIPTNSTGNAIDIQTNLSNCYKLRLQNIDFTSNAGKNIALGAYGTLADSIIETNQFAGRGTAHVDLGGATLTNNIWRGNYGGWKNEIKKKFTIASSGATTLTITFASEVSAALANSNYIVEGVIPDWTTTFRIQNKATDVLIIEFGTATPSINRTVDVTLSGLLPVY